MSLPKLSVFVILVFASLFLGKSVAAQIPSPYVGCDEVRPDLLHPLSEEFHSLRPYQASPCNQEPTETARFCGNRLVLTDSVGAVQIIPPYLAPNCSRLQNGNYKCSYQRTKTTKYLIDLSQARLPILGNTENVINSQQQSQDIDAAEKTNEYVSWYLNGIIGRAEYPYLSDSEEDLRKIVDFSGPIKKLLPFDIQNSLRANTVKKAVASKADDAGLRHDQIVGCTYGIEILGKEIGGIPAPCYESGLKSLLPRQEHRLSEWNRHIPPKSSDFDNFQDYWERYQEWRGKVCLPVEIPGFIPLIGGQKILLCGIENPFSPNYYSNLYSYIPFSSTEDRVGQVEVDSKSVTPVSEGLEIDNVNLVTTPAELYFAHTEEVADLAGILQLTFVPSGQPTTGGVSFVSPAEACDLTNIRTNPGDNLFAESINGTLTYDAKFSCEFEATETEAACEKEVSVGLGVVTQTPKADELWSRLVAGPSSIFKRIFPKVGSGGPILGILDIPASTNVTYSGSGLVSVGNPGARSGEEAELYFPHVGGISEYFLKGIQTILRPKGFGESILSGQAGITGGGACEYSDEAIEGAINNAASKYNVPASLLRAIFEIEGLDYIANPSGYVCMENAFGAAGLMQITQSAYNVVTCENERLGDSLVCTDDSGKLSRCDVNDVFELAARVLLWKAGKWSYGPGQCSATGGISAGDKQEVYNAACKYYGSFSPDALTIQLGNSIPPGQRRQNGAMNYCDIVCYKMGQCPPYP